VVHIQSVKKKKFLEKSVKKKKAKKVLQKNKDKKKKGDK